MSANDRIEELLKKIKNKSEPAGGLDENVSKEESPRRSELQKVEEVRADICLNDEDRKNMGIVNKIKANSLKSQKQLEAQEVIFNNQIERLKHQAEATERQSKAYWGAKSVDFSEGLKTYSQQNMQLLEQARFENKSQAVIDTYELANEKLKEVAEKNFPETVEEELMIKIVKLRDVNIARIEEDTLANRYELGPDK